MSTKTKPEIQFYSFESKYHGTVYQANLCKVCAHQVMAFYDAIDPYIDEAQEPEPHICESCENPE